MLIIFDKEGSIFAPEEGYLVYIPLSSYLDTFFFTIQLFYIVLESRTKPILTPYDGTHTRACESPALPLCYGRRYNTDTLVKKMPSSDTTFTCINDTMTQDANISHILGC